MVRRGHIPADEHAHGGAGGGDIVPFEQVQGRVSLAEELPQGQAREGQVHGAHKRETKGERQDQAG